MVDVLIDDGDMYGKGAEGIVDGARSWVLWSLGSGWNCG